MSENQFEERPVLTEPITYSRRKVNLEPKKIMPLLLVVAGILLLVFGGVTVYRRAVDRNQTSQATPTPTPTLSYEMPTATPTPELDRSQLKIQILNGSGVVGAAGVAATFLEEKGYADIKTGNAETYDYEETVLKIKEEKGEYQALLRADLAEKYSLAQETETLEADSSFDAVVILGTE